MLAVNADPSGWTIILIGHWNRAIFTPGWVIGRLTQSQQVDLDIQIESPELPIRILFDNLVLTVTPSRLQINIGRCENRLLQSAYRVAKGVLSELIHTPVSAVDISFRFNCNDPVGKLLDAFDIRDLSALADHGLVVERTVIRRGLIMSKSGGLSRRKGERNFYVRAVRETRGTLVHNTLILSVLTFSFLEAMRR